MTRRPSSTASSPSYPLAGLSLGVVTREGLTDSVQRGIATDDRAVELDTVFRIGSVTKTMTALALLQQWEAGRFDLDDPVNDHLVGLELVGRPEWRAPTFRHLLTHTGGIGELSAWSDLRRPMFGLATPVGGAVSRAPERYGGRVRLDVEPGTKWAYANHGFNVLGYLVETMSGTPYAEQMRSVLFDPLGMDHTDVVRSDRVVDRLATGYGNRRRGLHTSRDLDIETQAAGSVFSTLPDMANYAAALLDGGRGIVKPETLATAFEPHYRPCPTHPGIGLSFFRDDLGGRLTVGHGGGVPGFVTAFAIAPDEGVGVVAFTNGGGQAVAIAARRVLGALLGVDPGRTARPPAPAGTMGRARRLLPPRSRSADERARAHARRRARDRGPAAAVGARGACHRFPGWCEESRWFPPTRTGTSTSSISRVLGMPPMAIHFERNAGEPRRVALRWGRGGRVPRVAEDGRLEEPAASDPRRRRGRRARGRGAAGQRAKAPSMISWSSATVIRSVASAAVTTVGSVDW